MNIEKEIRAFDEACKPFYLVDHDNGTFSLCLTFAFNDDDFGQEAFNAYSREIGAPIKDNLGFYSHGSGYEWEAAFKEAFKNDPNLRRIQFDCEASGFFCNCDDLSLLKDFGTRFKALVDDMESFTKVVSDGIKAYEKQRDEFAKIEFKIKGRLTRHPDSNFMIRTVQGDVRLTPGDIRDILNKEVERITVGGTSMPINDFLMQDAYHIQPDLFERNTFQLITNEAYELQEQQMEEGSQDSQGMQQTM